MVSQFEIQENYTQINYKGTPYRVTPLRYADPIKWLYNQKKGLPAYIAVNMVDQNTDLVWLSSGMKYSTSEYFFRNINRYIRFCYPTRMFETISFEIDDDETHTGWRRPSPTGSAGGTARTSTARSSSMLRPANLSGTPRRMSRSGSTSSMIRTSSWNSSTTTVDSRMVI
ncbi:MAG: hypothetical protein ACLR8P_06980 [Clostridium fessum]